MRQGLYNTLLNLFAKKRIFISKILGTGVIALIIFSESIWEKNSSFDIMAMMLDIISFTLIIICILGRLWSAMYISGNKSETLITEGPYSMVRNPLYFFSFLGIVGIGLTSKSIINLTLIVSLFMIFYLPTILNEEKILLELHKQRFKDYKIKVPRIIPKFSLLSEPETYMIKPLAYRRNFSEVMWFFWIFLLLQIVEKLHGINLLPTFISIP